MSRIIVITSGKGGVGKSSTTINLGYALANAKNRVCLIDADFGLKNLDVMLGLENRVIYDLNDVISNKCSLSQILVKDKRFDSLYLLPACKSLSFENMNIEYMTKMIEHLKNKFDYILIDSPAGIEKGFQYATGLSHEAIVVITLDVTSLRDADRVIGLLMKQGITQMHMLINKYNDDDVLKHRCLSLKDASDILSIPLIGLVYDDRKMIETINRGMPLYLDNSSTSHCFDRIAKRLDGQEIPFQKSQRKPLFERIFGL
ncbi:MAG: septum site-determining protein MinD [Erysipelotrichaceae bacterium]|nr:septum site-determining protein MinD [Erysipelotrichaceae bacterium]